jgi:hypothetical protein
MPRSRRHDFERKVIIVTAYFTFRHRQFPPA